MLPPDPANLPRRRVIQIAAAGLASALAMANPVGPAAVRGDRLVEEDTEGGRR